MMIARGPSWTPLGGRHERDCDRRERASIEGCSSFDEGFEQTDRLRPDGRVEPCRPWDKARVGLRMSREGLAALLEQFPLSRLAKVTDVDGREFAVVTDVVIDQQDLTERVLAR